MFFFQSKLAFGLFGIAFATLPIAAWPVQASGKGSDTSGASAQVQRIAQEVYKQIVTLPQYGVFDDIHFALKGDSTVILRGEASRPTLKSACENVVKRIEGVKQVINEIEVLPLSQNDDRIRALTYARIYGNQWLQRYTNNRGGGRYISPMRAVTGITNDPPIGWHAIHIIVKNGNIRLVGVVDTSGDLAIAEMQARSVPGAFTVDNELVVAKPENKK
jgi:hyperosmotically inducible periplasmic protein